MEKFLTIGFNQIRLSVFDYALIFFNIAFSTYQFSDFSKLGKLSFSDYINKLNPSQTKVSNQKEFNVIEWEDYYTYYMVVFNTNGEFISIEREVWFEYKLPWFKKCVIYDSNKILQKKAI